MMATNTSLSLPQSGRCRERPQRRAWRFIGQGDCHHYNRFLIIPLLPFINIIITILSKGARPREVGRRAEREGCAVGAGCGWWHRWHCHCFFCHNPDDKHGIVVIVIVFLSQS